MVDVLDIGDFLLASEAVLGIDTHALARVTKIPLAESALAAPYATFGGHDFYKHPIERAAILASLILRNHPLPDGNKRVALILMVLNLGESGYRLKATPREIDRTFRSLAGRRMTEDYFTVWLTAHTERDQQSLRQVI
jgi:death on curing protein